MERRLSDVEIRTAFKSSLLPGYLHDQGSFVLEELGLRHGRARIDLAIVNGELIGFELKSDLDSLQRLPEQAMVYNSVLDRITLIVTERHLSAAVEQISEWWGIIIAGLDLDGAVSFREIRSPKINPVVEKLAVARLLWRTEALGILEELGAAEGFRSKGRTEIYTRLTELLDDETLRSRVRLGLSLRTDWRPDALQMSDDG
jgi:hypothetical protein